MSESIMNQYGVGQDEFIFRMYSIALVAIVGAAAVKGDLTAGIVWMLQPGTYEEQLQNVPIEDRSWSSAGKIAVMILFSSMGFFGSSCAAAITKQFGALSMSITSTARKATTLFLSFLLFDNECTVEHVFGIIIFIAALTVKSIRRKNKKRKSDNPHSVQKMLADLRDLGVVVSRSQSFGSWKVVKTSVSPRWKVVQPVNRKGGKMLLSRTINPMHYHRLVWSVHLEQGIM